MIAVRLRGDYRILVGMVRARWDMKRVVSLLQDCDKNCHGSPKLCNLIPSLAFGWEHVILIAANSVDCWYRFRKDYKILPTPFLVPYILPPIVLTGFYRLYKDCRIVLGL